MIKSIFYSRFHPEKGPAVLHQVPSGSISLSATHPSKHQQNSLSHSQEQGHEDGKTGDHELRHVAGSDLASVSTAQPLFSFAALSDYLIPRQEFCNALITVCINRFRVIGYPVCIVDRERYARNEFIFNFAIVVSDDAEVGVWSGVVRRVADLLREMEEGSGFLSWDEGEKTSLDEVEADTYDPPRRESRGTAPAGGRGKVYALCEMILEDLNNYCECMIPLDSANTLNLKLFPTYPPPPPVRTWHVPLLTVHLPSLMDQTWDLTMQRISPHINGVNSVERIAHLADADVRLVREAVRHLKYYGCCLLLDIFQFAAMYAVTPGYAGFAADLEMQQECARYVSVPASVSVAEGASGNAGISREEDEVTKDTVLRLYASLRQGVTLKAWCLENKDLLIGVDVRRLITFGVIKGFLYRVHKYAIASQRITNGQPYQQGYGPKRMRETKRHDRHEKMESRGGNYLEDDSLERKLSRYLDGLHCFDEICTELQLNDKALLSRLKAHGDVQIIHR